MNDNKDNNEEDFNKSYTGKIKMSSLFPIEIKGLMKSLGEDAKRRLPIDCLFCLAVYHSESGKIHYVSDMKRIDVPKALRELAKNMEKSIAIEN